LRQATDKSEKSPSRGPTLKPFDPGGYYLSSIEPPFPSKHWAKIKQMDYLAFILFNLKSLPLAQSLTRTVHRLNSKVFGRVQLSSTGVTVHAFGWWVEGDDDYDYDDFDNDDVDVF
jgi:hypothetical protein